MGKLLLIDKPSGITSFDVIRILRRELGIRKMGHSGTLDPLATGLLIIGIEEGTKELKDLFGLSKEYVAEIKLGVKTDTGDIDGEIIKKDSNLSTYNVERLEKVLNKMVGKFKIRVPIYSAIKRKGKSLYQYAREGKKIKPPKKVMEIYEAELLKYENNIVKIRFVVSSGTYIRSLAEKFGKKLKTVATVYSLRRTKIGDFKIENARKLKA